MKEIKHYMLPRISEGLYDKESISSIALTKEIAKKINELVDAYNFLSKERLSKILEQDGKIEKGVGYMKDNLANTIHDLFEVMSNAGEIQDILNEFIPAILRDEYTFIPLDSEVIAGVDAVKDVRYPYGHVNRYGAVGDGNTDDTTALNKAATICRANSFNLYATNGVYKITEHVDFTMINKVVFDADIVSHNESYVLVGNSSAHQPGVSYSFANAPGLMVTGLKNSNVSFSQIDKLYLYANGDDSRQSSIGYCTFAGNKATVVELYSEGNSIGWINENIFNIKRIDEIIIDGNYPHNNNHFEHCNLEKGNLVLKNARNNYFSARSEGGVTIEDTSNIEQNFHEKEYYYKHYFGENISETDNGTISFYPVHKLQTESRLMRIDKNNKKFPIGTLVFNANGSFNPGSYKEIYNSGMVEITGTVALKVKSSHKCFRVRVNFYDANKNRIVAESSFADGKLAQQTGDWSWQIPVNVDTDELVIHKSKEARYFTYSVLFGNDVDEMQVDYINIKLVKMINTDFEMDNTIKTGVYTQIPTTGYWERGTILYGAVPRVGANIGIVCVESGSPGVWANFAPIV